VGFFKRLIHREPLKNRLFVLGLDGLPLSFAKRAAAAGLMPNLAGLLEQGVLTPLKSVLPTVSLVAWANYATGVNPGKHGVFGFVDRRPNPFAVYIPTARDLKVPTMWEILSGLNKRVGVINVPLTFPPKAVNGFMVGCFLSPDLAKATYPVELAPRLMEMEYRIDADVALGKSDLSAFMADLNLTLSRRFSACFQLMRTEAWDFFHLHVMCTDRINHFLWTEYEEGGGLAEDFRSFYRKLDSYLGELIANLPAGCRLALISEHGFTRTKSLVYINRWLEENGYLLFGRGRKELMAMHAESKAYSLVPGRIYINLKGREERGSVPQGHPYEDLREELVHRLGGLSEPQTGEVLVQKVYKREELYAGPRVPLAPDLIIEPAEGYDFKANLDGPGLIGPPDLPGTHALEGAFLFLSDVKQFAEGPSPSLVDVAPTLLTLLEGGLPAGLDGRSLV